MNGMQDLRQKAYQKTHSEMKNVHYDSEGCNTDVLIIKFVSTRPSRLLSHARSS